MKQILPIFTAAVAFSAIAAAQSNPFLGRWDLTITTPQATYPDWIEVSDKGGKLDALIQPRSGGTVHAAEAKVDSGHLVLTVGGGRGPASTWELTAAGDKLTGSIKRGDTAAGTVAGVRAPKLDRPMPKAWTDPEPLFNGKDLTGWEPIGNPANNHWVAKDGELVNEVRGANLRSTRKFDDFKLHVELNCPEGGNSGIYMRGRYEMQVEYEPEGTEDKYHMMGAIYSFVAPTATVPRSAGKWETFDVTMVGRRITIVRDGVKTVDNQEIPGITGGALDSNEGEPGSFYIQGDHTAGIRFKNIRISVPKK
jgi:hypothetical protein